MSDGGDQYRVYLVECADGTLYTGIAKDVERRIEQHNQGKGARYTRGRTPVRLVEQSVPLTWGDALRLERAIKARPRSEKGAVLARRSTESFAVRPDDGKNRANLGGKPLVRRGVPRFRLTSMLLSTKPGPFSRPVWSVETASKKRRSVTALHSSDFEAREVSKPPGE